MARSPPIADKYDSECAAVNGGFFALKTKNGGKVYAVFHKCG